VSASRYFSSASFGTYRLSMSVGWVTCMNTPIEKSELRLNNALRTNRYAIKAR
jgi:hypothetical protein